ncbi:hypothetical protein ACSFA8_13190 [Variovorax sp. RT4R15]|uniref:hypothetical protein n=1 Tax=Variovorax sp. RT4R15 TaxID=3443737 RepID=UPI003F45F433
MRKLSAAWSLALVGLTLMGSAHAVNGTRLHDDSGPPPPPPEAVAACKGKTEGAQVSFTGRGGATFQGECRKLGDTLTARPSGAPPGGGTPPPR